MTASFLHGFETVEEIRGPLATRIVRTAVIGLVGTAGKGTVNEPVVLVGPDDLRTEFGDAIPDGSIHPALEAIWRKTLTPVVVVNVLDPTTHKADKPAAEFVLDATGSLSLGQKYVSAVVVKSQDGATTYVLGTDYDLDAASGVVTRIATGAIADLATLLISFSHPDPSAVLSSDIIGTIDAGGERTGAQALLGSASRNGLAPKILIAPGYSGQATVWAALDSLAQKLRAVALIDVPSGTTVAQAIAGRASGGAVNLQTDSKRLVLLYPDLMTDAGEVEPYSQHFAGVMAANDLANGYWSSPSNKKMPGVNRAATLISQSLSDPEADNQRLNAVGITTYHSPFFAGPRTFGNRSAAWPSSADPDVFVAVRRAADVIEDSIEQSMLDVLDAPITQGLIDGVVQRVNLFIQSLVARGALIDGWVQFDASKNPPSEIAQGRLVFTYGIAPPPPFERGTFEQVLDTSLLAALGAPELG